MFELSLLCFLALITMLAASRWPHAILILLILAAPYYGLSKQFLDPDSLLLAWKDVMLAGLMCGIFLRVHGRLHCPAAFFVFLLYCVVSACISPDWQSGLLGFRATCQWMLLGLAVASLRDATLVPKLGKALIWSGTLASVVYIFERSFLNTQDDIALSMGIRADDRWRFDGVLERFSLVYGNPNALAVFLIICACFAFGWYLSQKAGRMRTLLLAYGVICVAGVLYTASRGAIPAMMVALMVLGKGASRRVRRAILLIALAGAVLLVQPDLLSRRLSGTTSTGFFNSYRYLAWTGTIERALSSYQLLSVGSGLGTYGGYVSDQTGASDVITENQYLKVLGEQGILGVILFLVLIARMRRPGAEVKTNGQSAVPAAIAAVLTYCMVGNLLDGMIVAVPFWTLAGIRLAALRQRLPVKEPLRHLSSIVRSHRWSNRHAQPA